MFVLAPAPAAAASTSPRVAGMCSAAVPGSLGADVLCACPASSHGADGSLFASRDGLPCSGAGDMPLRFCCQKGLPSRGARQGVSPDGNWAEELLTRAGEEQAGTSQPSLLLQQCCTLLRACREGEELKITPEGFSGSEGSRNGWRVGRSLPGYQRFPFQLCKLGVLA